MHLDLGFENYLRETTIILSNLILSYPWLELTYCKEDWEKLVASITKSQLQEDTARRIKSVVDRLK
jgi:hypothetical protein